ncbi:hypothetical protein GC176_28220 [bacterium]|nr:hypothetical protein [bacterium]
MTSIRFMRCTALHMACLIAAMLAAVTYISGCEQATFAEAPTVVRASDGHLTVRSQGDASEQTRDVAADAAITIDGQPATLEDLHQGDTVRLKTEQRQGAEVVTQIKAHSQTHQTAPANSTARPQPDMNKADAGKMTESQPDDTRAGSGPVQPAPQKPQMQPEAPATDSSATGGKLQNQNKPDTDGERPEGQTSAAISAPTSAPNAGVPALDPYSLQPATETQARTAALAEETHSGTVDRIEGKQFILKDGDGKEFTFAVEKDTAFTIGGAKAVFADLKKGVSVTVTARKDGEALIATTVVEMTSAVPLDPSLSLLLPSRSVSVIKTVAFSERGAALAEDSFSGTIDSLKDDRFSIKDDDGRLHTFLVNSSTTYTLDGNEATFSELKKGQTAKVKAEKNSEHFVATMVDAVSAK